MSRPSIFGFEAPISNMFFDLRTTLDHQHNFLDKILVNHGCNALQTFPGQWSDPRLIALLKKNPSLLEGKIYSSLLFNEVIPY